VFAWVTGPDHEVSRAIWQRLEDEGAGLSDSAGDDCELIVCTPALPPPAPLLGGDPRRWYADTAMRLSAVHADLCEGVPAMRQAGGGRIVIVRAQAWPGDDELDAGGAALCLALGALVKTLGRELAPARILVNGIAVGPDAEPADVAEVVSFLASPGASAVVGQILRAGGVAR
jgi:NAD(P)-dependent dehydrogenase (short-subunit alcohol dehydrogenase family)